MGLVYLFFILTSTLQTADPKNPSTWVVSTPCYMESFPWAPPNFQILYIYRLHVDDRWLWGVSRIFSIKVGLVELIDIPPQGPIGRTSGAIEVTVTFKYLTHHNQRSHSLVN